MALWIRWVLLTRASLLDYSRAPATKQFIPNLLTTAVFRYANALPPVAACL